MSSSLQSRLRPTGGPDRGREQSLGGCGVIFGDHTAASRYSRRARGEKTGDVT